jgi:hypothetical protein
MIEPLTTDYTDENGYISQQSTPWHAVAAGKGGSTIDLAQVCNNANITGRDRVQEQRKRKNSQRRQTQQ